MQPKGATGEAVAGGTQPEGKKENELAVPGTAISTPKSSSEEEKDE